MKLKAIYRTLIPSVFTCINLISPTSSLFAKDLVLQEPTMPNSCDVLMANNTDATQTIQQALNHCEKGKAVYLAPNGEQHVFTSGPLFIPSERSLVIQSGVTLKAINRAASFDKGKQTCGTLDHHGSGCQPFITFDHVKHSGLYGPGTIDGQGGIPLIDLPNTTWWSLATDAKQAKLKQNNPRLIQMNHSQDITLYNIHLINSPNFHVVFKESDGLTAWGVNIKTPENARNTDGIDPGSSKNVIVAYSQISTGDDNVAIKANTAPAENMLFIHNYFGTGHGMSIGSETNGGVFNIRVDDLTMDHTTNGLRIKSDQSAAGEVANISYNHVHMHDVKYPIVIDTVYEKKSGYDQAYWHDLNYHDISSDTSGKVVINGLNARAPIEMNMSSIQFTPDTTWSVINANITK
ncbi:glycoside hydrolase family 28 protein [Acinetobacter nectaris]|uniref:glycoside hydrolase family 28 protein n=1 Tax=Acinetobacter nectaris TaxID=1219382 RepID=UPI001F421AD1|nr:glycosyl hydrolase family 28 protein [Acinetobacter nectaris]MCF9045467.1 polygalacturonase [Acinetobacter nectaris]